MNDWRGTPLLGAVIAVGLAVAACSTVRYSTDHDPEVSFAEYQTYEWVAATEEEQAVMQRINPFLERRLRRAVERELADRGFEAGREGEADFLVSVYPVVPARKGGGEGEGSGHTQGSRPRIGVTVGFAVGVGHPYGYGYRYPYFGYGFPYFGYRYPYGYTPFWVGFGYPYFAAFYPAFVYPGYGSGYYHSAGGYGYAGRPAWAGLEAGTVVVDVFDASRNELVWRGWAEGALLELPGAEELDAYVDEIVGEVMKGFPPEGAQR